jgi:hypothetical protein
VLSNGIQAICQLKAVVALTAAAACVSVLAASPARASSTAPQFQWSWQSSTSTGGQQNGNAEYVGTSGNGRLVLFSSFASNLVPGDTNGNEDVFVRDQQTGTLQRVDVTSSGAQIGDGGTEPVISASGRYVAFVVQVTKVGLPAIYVRDLQTHTTRLVKAATQHSGGLVPMISASGRYIAYMDIPSSGNIFFKPAIFDQQTGKTLVLPWDAGASLSGGFSGDGTRLSFTSTDPRLNHDHAGQQIFVYDRTTNTVTRVSGAPGNGKPNGEASDASSMSGNGRYVAFLSLAHNLVPNTPAGEQEYLHDMTTGRTTRVSAGLGSSRGLYPSDPVVSSTGRYVAFTWAKTATLYLRDTHTGRTLSTGVNNLSSFGFSNDERTLVLGTSESLTSADTNIVADVYTSPLSTKG